jgi:hypothetical protein
MLNLLRYAFRRKMKARVVYIEPEKAKRINEILAAEREFREAEENVQNFKIY